jgi:hypothetical protein
MTRSCTPSLFYSNPVTWWKFEFQRRGQVWWQGTSTITACWQGQFTEADAKYLAIGIYYVLNKINPALLGRAYNRLRERAEHTTADNNILWRRWLPVDLDPVRPAGISSSEGGHAAAIRRARTIADDMEKEWERPIIADSGNGAHLLYRIDLPNSQEALAFVSGALAELDRRYSDDEVKVDVTCANAARIWKAYGTVARKGDSIPGLPHRFSQILEVPGDK